MRAVVYKGKTSISVEDVADPRIEEPTDAIIRITSTAICGSDLHLYGGYVPGMKKGDILGHEPMGIVEEVGSAVEHIRPGDRVVVPFNIACGTCYFCERGLQSQCETTQNPEFRKGGSLFGYTHLYGGVDGGQAEYLRVPMAHFGAIKVPEGPPDDRFLFLSDVLPTAWQAVAYADIPREGTVAVLGLGPIGQMCGRIARHLGASRVFGVDPVRERRAMAARHGMEVLESTNGDVEEHILDMTDGYGVDSAIDAVGLEASGSFADSLLQTMKLQPDRLKALHTTMGVLRRGGTLSITGVYIGMFPLWPIGALFDKQIAVRSGQANVKRWVDDIMPLLGEEDPLGTGDLVTHRLPLDEAPRGYEIFRAKEDGCVKVVLEP